jgi:hypothetical protein
VIGGFLISAFGSNWRSSWCICSDRLCNC